MPQIFNIANSRYKDLPLNALHELMFGTVTELLQALDYNDHIALRVKKRECEAIHNAILIAKDIEKRSAERPGNSI